MMMHEAAVFAYLSPAALFRIRLLNEKGKEDSDLSLFAVLLHLRLILLNICYILMNNEL